MLPVGVSQDYIQNFSLKVNEYSTCFDDKFNYYAKVLLRSATGFVIRKSRIFVHDSELIF